MANKMLIDAAHPEETRVVVLRGNRVEEFDFESASRKPLRGNIYLAKVTRVEPSLQAAFVDYGGNRHGFLAFSEIHPDYYQIPVADRQALIEAEERENAEAEEHAAEVEDTASDTAESSVADTDDGAAVAAEASSGEVATAPVTEPEAEITASVEIEPGSDVATPPEEAEGESHNDSVDVVSDQSVELVGAEDALEELPERRRPRTRQYKIQEVIKRRQVLLVQVVKEERGNKGAALTTYLSLAGRYSVLMPNTSRGGGISRKITSPADRKRLKQLATDLEVPEGMGIILRTAGASRTKAEVKRDFEYLLRLWENVRELTLRSSAPTLVYEEGSLIKRSIRDLYNKDIDEILVAGDESYREAKDFMRMLMPSHAKNVKPYRDKQPLFARSGIETQLDAMFSPQVTLRSGGYIVINQTEALVSIDVNSGRSTREHNIEDTAYQTNLEAAEEVARQLRLRDLAGLIVIDFIDMEEKRNNRAVERKLKDALKNDRARIQVGRISHFGLLEMSRQRIRTGVLESTTTVCAVCQGTGHVRAPASVALHVLRSVEDQLLRGVTHHLTIRARTAVALYILNQKRAHLSELEQRFGLHITVMADETVTNGSHFQIERGEPVGEREALPSSVQPDSVPVETAHEDEAEPLGAEVPEEEEEVAAPPRDIEDRGEHDKSGGRRRRRRRRRRGSDGDEQAERVTARGEHEEDEGTAIRENEEHETAAADDDDGQRKRRRGRRGGRRGRRGRGEDRNGSAGVERDHRPQEPALSHQPDFDPYEIDTTPVMEPKPRHESTPEPVAEWTEAAPAITSERQSEDAAERAGHRSEPHQAQAEDAKPARDVRPEPVSREPEPVTQEEEAGKPKRSGWWQRRSFF